MYVVTLVRIRIYRNNALMDMTIGVVMVDVQGVYVVWMKVVSRLLNGTRGKLASVLQELSVLSPEHI